MQNGIDNSAREIMSSFQIIPYSSAEDAVFKALGVEKVVGRYPDGYSKSTDNRI